MKTREELEKGCDRNDCGKSSDKLVRFPSRFYCSTCQAKLEGYDLGRKEALEEIETILIFTHQKDGYPCKDGHLRLNLGNITEAIKVLQHKELNNAKATSNDVSLDSDKSSSKQSVILEPKGDSQ